MRLQEGALLTVLPAGKRPPSGVVSGSLHCVQAAAPVVANVSSNATSWSLTGPAAPVPGVALGDMLANLSLGRAVVNVYTANFPQPLQPMGCCNNAEARNPATLKFENPKTPGRPPPAAAAAHGLLQQCGGTQPCTLTPGVPSCLAHSRSVWA